jgi:hypothetical protein
MIAWRCLSPRRRVTGPPGCGSTAWLLTPLTLPPNLTAVNFVPKNVG